MRPAAIAVPLLAVHAVLVAAGGHLPDAAAAVLAGTVYAPLALAQAVGLPVFGPAAAGGWAPPAAWGWVLLGLAWLAAWWSASALGLAVWRRARR